MLLPLILREYREKRVRTGLTNGHHNDRLGQLQEWGKILFLKFSNRAFKEKLKGIHWNRVDRSDLFSISCYGAGEPIKPRDELKNGPKVQELGTKYMLSSKMSCYNPRHHHMGSTQPSAVAACSIFGFRQKIQFPHLSIQCCAPASNHIPTNAV